MLDCGDDVLNVSHTTGHTGPYHGGGGQGAFIGAVHRIAARLNDAYVLVCGALSSERERAQASAAKIGLDPARSYASYTEMFVAERNRSDGMEVAAIVTPNRLHYPVARAALQAGFHVICDKPLATSEAEADELVRLAVDADRIFAITYNYSGYPMVRQARAMVARGDIGALRVVQVEYAQEWLAGPLEATGQKQAEWRTDPLRSGPGGAIGDIGSHAFHLACFVTGCVPEQLLTDLSTFVPGRRVDDNAHVLLRFAGGARGVLWASQVAHGNENALRLRVYGEKGGLEWAQEEPDRLWFMPSDGPRQMLTRGGPRFHPEAARSRACQPATQRATLRALPRFMQRWHALFERRARVRPSHRRCRFPQSWMATAVFVSSPRVSGPQPKGHAG